MTVTTASSTASPESPPRTHSDIAHSQGQDQRNYPGTNPSGNRSHQNCDLEEDEGRFGLKGTLQPELHRKSDGNGQKRDGVTRDAFERGKKPPAGDGLSVQKCLLQA